MSFQGWTSCNLISICIKMFNKGKEKREIMENMTCYMCNHVSSSWYGYDGLINRGLLVKCNCNCGSKHCRRRIGIIVSLSKVFTTKNKSKTIRLRKSWHHVQIKILLFIICLDLHSPIQSAQSAYLDWVLTACLTLFQTLESQSWTKLTEVSGLILMLIPWINMFWKSSLFKASC